MWTPLPPQTGSSASDSSVLLPALAQHVGVVAVVDDWVAPLTDPPTGCDLMSASEFVALGQPADVSLYHLADHFEEHAFIHDAAIRQPGVVVLHDLSLFNLYRVMHLRDPEQLRAEFWLNHGPDAEIHASRGLLLRRVIEHSLGVMVDNPAAAFELRRRFPAVPVDIEPRPLLPPDPGDLSTIRRDADWDEDVLVIGVLGTLDQGRRGLEAVDAVAACRAVDPRVRLLIAGRAQDPAVVDAIAARVASMPRGEGRIVLDPSPALLDHCVAACDLLVDLRVGDFGRVPALVQRALTLGMPTIVSDLPQLRHFAAERCWRVDPGPPGVAQATRHILRRLHDPPAAGSPDRGASRPDVRQTVEAHLAAARRAVAEPRLAIREPPASDRPLNVYGDFLAATGLMEAGRRLTRAVVDSPVDVRIVDINSYGPSHTVTRGAPEFANVPRGPNLAGDNLWLANINEFTLIPDAFLHPPGSTGRVAAFWYWELSTLTEAIARQPERVDEIWVASEFVRDTFRRYTSKPVHAVPLPVEPRLPYQFSRRDYDLPEDALLYFFHFDAHSVVSRKNPFGLIKAFRKAFEPSERGRSARLVIKCVNLAPYPRFEAALYRAMDEIDGIILRDELGASEMAGLLASIDVYVSLHRSEGFGLGIAEAMALGKPAVATAYSGPADFLRPLTSCPVGYRLRPILDLDHEWWPEGAYMYPPGHYWAEPDLDSAARWMRQLHDEPATRQRIGQAGARDVTDRYSAARTRARVLELLRRPVPAMA